MLRSIRALVISGLFTTDFFFFMARIFVIVFLAVFLQRVWVQLLLVLPRSPSWAKSNVTDHGMFGFLKMTVWLQPFHKKNKKKRCNPNFRKPEIKASSLCKSIAIHFTHEFTGGGMITANVSILRWHNLSHRVAPMALETSTGRCKPHGPYVCRA